MFRISCKSGRVIHMALIAAVWASARATAGEDCSGLPPIDGRDLSSRYAGSTTTIQDNATGFGDVLPPSPQPSEGSELDQLFVSHDLTHLHVGITGNTPRTDDLNNTIIVFLDTNDVSNASSLDTDAFVGGSGALQGMDNVHLDFGMTPEFVLEAWNENGANHAVMIDLTAGTAAAVELTEGVDYAWNNENLAGASDEPSHDPILQQDQAATATRGIQFKIALSTLASTHDIRIQALVASGSGFISNQNLPPLNPTSGFNGGGEPCIGAQGPDNEIDFNMFNGDQFDTHDLSGGSATPDSFTGEDIPSAFGPAALLATQNNYTCFENAEPFAPPLSEGSEIDALYVSSDFSNLYVGVTGQTPINDGLNNTILVFIQTPNSSTCNRLNTVSLGDGSGALQNMDGLQFDGTVSSPGCVFDGFRPDYCLQFWRQNGTNHAIVQNMDFDVVTELIFSIDPEIHTGVGDAYAADLRNIEGVNNIRGDDPLRQEDNAATAVDGMQFSISLNTLGLSDADDIKVLAMIAGGSGFISNQFLPPLNATDPTPLTSTDAFTPNAPLADAGVTTDTRTLENADALARITGVSVTVDITHPAVEQLSIDLRHDASGVTVRLWDGSGSGADMQTTFAEDGDDLSNWTAPGIGTFAPVQSLLSFNDLDPNEGPWSLIVTDSVSGDSGTLNSWTLDLREDIGGAINCLGEVTPQNPIDLNNFPGDNFVTLTLDPENGAPSTFTGTDIPGAWSATATSAWATQNNFTCFGDAVEAPPVDAPGSEMDQLFMTNDVDRLKVAITGNLEENGNAFIVLLDTDPDGGVPLDNDGNAKIQGITSPPRALGGNGGNEPGLNGLSLDPDFNPDYGVVVQRDAAGGVPLDNYDVFVTHLPTNVSRKIGTLVRNSGSGELLPPAPSAGGSELDQMFVQNDADNLYIGLTGNLEGNGNTFIVFIETPGSTETNVLDTASFPGALGAVNGDTLDADFAPNYAIVMHRSGGVYSATVNNISDTLTDGLTFTTETGPNTFIGDNLNAEGVTGTDLGEDDAEQQTINAATATRGVQFAIARSSLGNLSDSDQIEISAVLVSNSGFWSNQTLPGLGGSLENQGFNTNLDNLAGDQFIAFTLSDTYSAPTTFTGADIPNAMGDVPLATQNNYTQFGDAVLPPDSGNPNCMQVAFDNSNILGVTATSSDLADTADTGMEFDIPFADVGLTSLEEGGELIDVKAMAVLTGQFGYLSNQFLPGLHRDPDAGNLMNIPPAGLKLADESIAPGLQFLTHTLFVPGDPADINGDGVVNEQDVIDFANVLLGLNTDEPDVTNSDFDGNGVADGDDIDEFLAALAG